MFHAYNCFSILMYMDHLLEHGQLMRSHTYPWRQCLPAGPGCHQLPGTLRCGWALCSPPPSVLDCCPWAGACRQPWLLWFLWTQHLVQKTLFADAPWPMAITVFLALFSDDPWAFLGGCDIDIHFGKEFSMAIYSLLFGWLWAPMPTMRGENCTKLWLYRGEFRREFAALLILSGL